MKTYSGKDIRNVVVLGHSGSGKTTVIEGLLKQAKITKRMGTVDDGNTVSDYESEEIRRKVSINSSIVPIEWENTKINFIDTPGYFDFVAEALQAIRVADAAVIVVNAKSGNEVGVEKAWEYVNKYNIPRLILINGLDDEEANFDNLLDNLRELYGKSLAPFQEPFFTPEGKFIGFINVITEEAKELKNDEFIISEIPEASKDRLAHARTMILEIAAEADEKLLNKYFSEEKLSIDEIYHGLNIGIVDTTVAPVLCSAATQTIGMEMLLNTLIKAFPAATTLHPTVKGHSVDNEDEIIEFKADDDKLSAFVFKTIADPYVGRLNLFRVYSGSIKKDDQIYNASKDIIEKAGHLFILRGKEQIEVSEIKAGDIGALARLNETSTQDTLCSKDNPIILDKIDLPTPLHAMAIKPKGKGDEDKINSALSKLMEEDLTLKSKYNVETKESLVYAVSDQQLDVLLHNLKDKYKIEAELFEPIIPFREMITKKARVQGRHRKQSGGHGQYGDVIMEFEPSGDLTTPFIFEEKVFGGSVPKQYFPAVEKGLLEAVDKGILAGYPMVGVKATLLDGSYHPVDSSEMAFKLATQLAYREGIPQAAPTLLEPIARLEVTIPDNYTGDIMGDVNRRRGRVLGMNPVDGKQVIEAEVPIAELYQYGADLRSMTQSRGEYYYEFIRYEEMPREEQEKIIKARQSKDDE